MILTSIILFAVAATIGLFLVFLGMRYHRSSLTAGLIHACFAITAFGFLAIQIYQGPINKYNNSAVLFMVLALIGGIMLLSLRKPKKSPPMVLVAMHAVMAMIGFLILVLGYQ